MIFYFTGTGNSQYIAEVINETLNDQIIFINEELKENKNEVYHSKEPYVFVVPTYAYRIPRVIETFILNHQFKGNQDIYFILTCGANIGNASQYGEKLAESQNMNYKGMASIVMPENYIAMFTTPSNEEARTIIQAGKQEALKIARVIKAQQSLPSKKKTLLGGVLSTVVNPCFYRLFVSDKGFQVNDDCIHCLKCVNICPLQNIHEQNGKIEFLHHCTHCMACISSCPKEAIIYKNRTQKKNHYYLRNAMKENK